MGPLKPCDGIAGVRMVAREQIFCDFEGKNAHAGGNPWDGINALDAFVASYNNISMLRQQTNDTDRIHSAILEAPKAANIIPAQIRAMFTTRSQTLKSLKALTARVTKCVEAGALATGCTVKITKYFISPSPIHLDIHRTDFGRAMLTSGGQINKGKSTMRTLSSTTPCANDIKLMVTSTDWS